VYSLTNSVENLRNFRIYCAFSAKNPSGGDDIWQVAWLPAGSISTGTDIDYIRTYYPGMFLCWGGNFGGIVDSPSWRTSDWVKIRQMVTTTINWDSRRPELGFLYAFNTFFGVPTPALAEARKYDSGWHLLGNKATRGTEAVKRPACAPSLHTFAGHAPAAGFLAHLLEGRQWRGGRQRRRCS
jgi:hypothetical protein